MWSVCVPSSRCMCFCYAFSFTTGVAESSGSAPKAKQPRLDLTKEQKSLIRLDKLNAKVWTEVMDTTKSEGKVRERGRDIKVWVCVGICDSCFFFSVVCIGGTLVSHTRSFHMYRVPGTSFPACDHALCSQHLQGKQELVQPDPVHGTCTNILRMLFSIYFFHFPPPPFFFCSSSSYFPLPLPLFLSC